MPCRYGRLLAGVSPPESSLTLRDPTLDDLLDVTEWVPSEGEQSPCLLAVATACCAASLGCCWGVLLAGVQPAGPQDARVLLSCATPSLSSCKGLGCSRCRTWHLSLLNFVKLLLARSSHLGPSEWRFAVPGVVAGEITVVLSKQEVLEWAVRGACCCICRVFMYSETTLGGKDVHAACITWGLFSSCCHDWWAKLHSLQGPLGPWPAQSDPVAGRHYWRHLSDRAKESYLEVISVSSE